jgi:hypothetical protein
MRVLEALLVVLAVACVHDHPVDPRKHDAETFARSGLGAWVKVTTNGRTLEGELISVDGVLLHVFSERSGAFWVFAQKEVSAVDVYPIADVDGLVAIRTLGGLAMLPHGWWLVLSWPIYFGITASVINGHIDPIVHYPDHPWSDLAKWARFPQGLPEGVGLPELVNQLRDDQRRPTPHSPPPDAGIETPPVDAPEPAP